MDVGVGQESALSLILSIIFISLIFHIFEKRVKNLEIPISFISFVDNGLFISQEKYLDKTNANLFCSYNIISQSNLVSLSIEKLKFFIFPGYMASSALPYWISATLEALSFNPKICENI